MTRSDAGGCGFAECGLEQRGASLPTCEFGVRPPRGARNPFAGFYEHLYLLCVYPFDCPVRAPGPGRDPFLFVFPFLYLKLFAPESCHSAVPENRKLCRLDSPSTPYFSEQVIIMHIDSSMSILKHHFFQLFFSTAQFFPKILYPAAYRL